MANLLKLLQYVNLAGIVAQLLVWHPSWHWLVYVQGILAAVLPSVSNTINQYSLPDSDKPA